MRIADGADDPLFKIFLATDKIENLLLDGIVEHAIDGEVASFSVLLGSCRIDASGPSSIDVAAVFAEGSDFIMVPLLDDDDDAKGNSDRNGAGKQSLDLFDGS